MTTDPRQMTHDELNREAASGVMGWEVHGPLDSCDVSSDGRKHYRNGRVFWYASGTHMQEWSPATSIADAKELWTELRKDGWAICITDPHVGTLVGVSMVKRIGLSVEAVAETEAKAITIAAIMAKREEKK